MTFPEFCEEHELSAEEIELAWAMVQIIRSEQSASTRYMREAGRFFKKEIDGMALDLYRKNHGLDA